LRLLRQIGAGGRYGDLLDVGHAHDALHHGRVRHHDRVILVGARTALPFDVEDTDDLEGNFFDADHAAERFSSPNKL
jgi:hypothetical protein